MYYNAVGPNVAMTLRSIHPHPSRPDPMSDTPDDRPPIPESDEALLAECRVETFSSGGKGGQHQNRTASGVRLVHLPTGTRAVSRDERSQVRNRSIAVKRLREKLEEARRVRPARKATGVPKREKERRLESKKRRAETKARRRPPRDADDS